ncbi:MATERNAL EFFECT EMBRYO ARREST 46, EMBRYO SAC DEVELOPMENT ARREST 8 [Hibiscus trionum]|uniref:MATERNAL EFFECT EMBRYO ARREST 46, EMBRYO SAC DEVELOPMENT ARREST 8 n=1 Tax=Hibiscus trionum TaxID=183268 RepID=A0A9W7HYD5_HIBTR|nr:MATERNAL EFFECT EMBRYO ARREST 46, EMBRYO SAC DEVELOPMENT ARREST 8 [Hibiscus trionum]
MRIRKNKKLSSLICPPESVHDCRLNQSTWDAIPSPEQPYLHLQFEYEDVFNGNGSIGDSMGAVESVATMVGSKVGGMVIDDNDDDNEIGTAKQFGFEEEEDKESNLLKSCSNSSDTGSNIKPTGGSRRASGKGPSSASNPYEFYYYSGFGPSWGKKRRGGGKVKGINKNHMEPKEVEINGSVITAQNNSALSYSSQIDDNEEFDYVDEGEEEEDSGKKRMRKPIKARSLKSLM